MNCTYHIERPITLICVGPHLCQRKLCIECLHEREHDAHNTILIDKFREEVLVKLKEYELDQQSEFFKYEMNLKSMFSQTLTKTKKVWEELSVFIFSILDMIEMENKSYTKLINENNLAEYSYSDLEKLVQMVKGKVLDDWDVQKSFFLVKLQKAQSQFEEELQTFIYKIQENVKGILSSIKIKRIEPFVWKETTQELTGIDWDYRYKPPLQTKINLQITFTNNKEIQYLMNGQIIRRDLIKDTSQNPEIMTNLEQIKFLTWTEEYNNCNQKIGKSMAFWDCQTNSIAGGQYSNEGQKVGLWKEIRKNFSNEAKVFEVGEYVKGLRQSSWNYIYEDKEIIGGEYCKKGRKNGMWLELSDSFGKYFQGYFEGEYKNGKKVGGWNILCQKENPDHREKIQINKQFMLSGGGYYDDLGDEIKIGQWIEFDDMLYHSKKVIYRGEYKNGKKVGKWCIEYKHDSSDSFTQMQNILQSCTIFKYGYLVVEDHMIKKGMKLKLTNGQNQMINLEILNRQRIKVNIKMVKKLVDGLSSILLIAVIHFLNCRIFYIKYQLKNCELSGGGSYDQEGKEIKISEWLELDDQFSDIKQVTYNGKYQNGQKVGLWKIFDQQNLKGVTYYDINGIEIYQSREEIIYFGEFQNQQKIGGWDIYYLHQKMQQIYKVLLVVEDHMMMELKTLRLVIGLSWIKDLMMKNKQLIEAISTMVEKLVYGIFVTKINLCNTILQRAQLIKYAISGGGSYNEEGENIKIGKWLELDLGFNERNQLTFGGHYNNGRKVGQWKILYKNKYVQYYYVKCLKIMMRNKWWGIL
ncbi:unnamed protein product [Paramecium octaurelia]|uniref:MORN repeat protein n=1 Tax=Paramecium octaurelia TaxID=43137 RepID=A0A8S1YCE6_PAROT|nr:unnamed protein product [Paramecium octaurelia]